MPSLVSYLYLVILPYYPPCSLDRDSLVYILSDTMSEKEIKVYLY